MVERNAVSDSRFLSAIYKKNEKRVKKKKGENQIIVQNKFTVDISMIKKKNAKGIRKE